MYTDHISYSVILSNDHVSLLSALCAYDFQVQYFCNAFLSHYKFLLVMKIVEDEWYIVVP